MYKVLRNTHLFLGIAAFLFVTMYGLSSVQMAHQTWFSMKPQVTETRLTVSPETSEDPRAIAAELRRAGLRGEMRDVETNAAGYRIYIQRPGTFYRIDYTRATREAKVRIQTTGFMGMLNRIHHIGGTWHDYWLINVWGIFVALVSVTLILLGATGIYLWFKTHGERAIGVVLLAINLGICVTLLVLVRTA